MAIIKAQIHLIKWGATMVLADFFYIRQVKGSKSFVAVKLDKTETQDDRREWATTDGTASADMEVYPARETEDGYEIKFNDRYQRADLWSGKRVSIDTYN